MISRSSREVFACLLSHRKHVIEQPINRKKQKYLSASFSSHFSISFKSCVGIAQVSIAPMPMIGLTRLKTAVKNKKAGLSVFSL
ncbi:hypothetical protein [Acidocella sp.]|uniref:hypothetical protein n=1 Tax=Acidocella sp. TaxID=50710 RepID=UPI0018403BCD|nr:hypothetical protein [Acidocella sp.]NNM56206.1 hypothetical protein [Acidocella sp.]